MSMENVNTYPSMNPYENPNLMSMNAAAAYYSRFPVPPSYSKSPSWRKGKWLDEEEAYTKKLIEAFNAGYLNISSGTTLRSFLSDRLSCDPMRITKKFSGSSCIGKQVFTPCDPKTVDPAVMAKVQEELKELEEKFRVKVDGQRMVDFYPIAPGTPFAPFPPSAAAAFSPRIAYMEGVPPAEYYAALSQHQYPPMIPNPYMMKMYPGQEMAIPYLYPHPYPAKYSPQHYPTAPEVPSLEAKSENNTPKASVANQPIIGQKRKSPLTIDETKTVASTGSNSNNKSPKKQKTERKSKLPKVAEVPPLEMKGDLDASNLLLNFFKAASEDITRSRSASSEYETTKFEIEIHSSTSSSALNSATNLAEMVSCSSSVSDHEELNELAESARVSEEENQYTLADNTIAAI